MNDREVLEAAARAAGIVDAQWQEEGWISIPYEHLDKHRRAGDRRIWNPLEDDSDALRLAVKLRMQIDIIDTQVRCLAANGSTVYELDLAGPSYAATRRAIVRAAASMGEKS